MEVKITTGTKKIMNLRKRIRGVAGGASASKTVSILMWLIDYANSTEGLWISVVSETFPHLKRGAMRDFLALMQNMGMYQDKKWNKTDCIYEFPHHSFIEFFSADQPGKVRGPRRDVLFINECNNISYETYTQLEIRTKSLIWLDWNPVSEFWWYTEVWKKQDVDFITLTYKDNEALDQLQVDALEARKNNHNWWRVYGEGQLGDIEGRIYTGWELIDSVPFGAKLERYGLDFGYTNDPTAIIALYKLEEGFIIDEVLYQRGMKNNQIADTFQNLDFALVIADNNEPKSIEEIHEYGVNIIGVTKGQDSVRQGINFVQDQKISVTKRSINVLKEYRAYLWQQDPQNNGKFIQKPEGGFDHTMDAVRYAFDKYRRQAQYYLPPKNDISERDWSFK